MGFTLEEMKTVHARLSDLNAASSQELTQTTVVLDFVAGIDRDTQQQLAGAASSVRSRRGHKAVLSAEEETAENLRLYAEVEVKLGRVWMKKYDLQESKAASFSFFLSLSACLSTDMPLNINSPYNFAPNTM